MGRKAGITAEETRERLLEAAMRVLLRDGYAGTRVSEIAKEAGIRAGSIYNHFPSKADLLMTTITAHVPNAVEDLLQGGNDVSVLDAFERIGGELSDPRRRTFADSQSVAPALIELMATAGREQDVADVVRNAFVDSGTEIVEIIRLAQDHGEIDKTLDAEALARFVHMVAMGSLALGAVGLESVDEAAWAGVIGRMIDAVRPKVVP